MRKSTFGIHNVGNKYCVIFDNRVVTYLLRWFLTLLSANSTYYMYCISKTYGTTYVSNNDFNIASKLKETFLPPLKLVGT